MHIRNHLVISVVIMLAMVATASADNGQIEIGPTTSFPIVIDEPGSYVLTADLNVTVADVDAIEIHSNNVTLDLAGHVIEGPGTGAGNGIETITASGIGITIRNGHVRRFSNGIKMQNNRPKTVENITATENPGYGINLKNATVADCSAVNNGKGIYCDTCVVRNCYAALNSSEGFYTYGSVVAGCVAADNGGDGFWAAEGSLVSECVATGNDGYGVSLQATSSSGGSNVVNSTGYENTLGNIENCGNNNGCHQNYMP